MHLLMVNEGFPNRDFYNVSTEVYRRNGRVPFSRLERHN